MPELGSRTVTVVDIVDCPTAYDRYAEHIPVLEIAGVPEVLCWPFNADQVLDWLEGAGR